MLYIYRFVGPYLTLSSDLSFVLEDNEGVCGYVLAALDSSQFYHEFRTKWLPQIVGKYPIITQTEHMTPEQVNNVVMVTKILIIIIIHNYSRRCSLKFTIPSYSYQSH